MKKTLFCIALLAFVPRVLMAQQLPDPHFEKWTDKFNKDAQLADWHGSNVDQMLKFTLLFSKPGRTGQCAYIANRRVGAMGITEVSPGYMALGKPWSFMKGLNTKSATGGTEGGIAFTYRPDTLAVWIKRTGPHTADEDFHVLYYAWAGTAKGNAYMGSNGSCTQTSRVNEECDVRSETNGNKCGLEQAATHIAEGWLHPRAEYKEWTRVKVPIYYRSNTRPAMCNVIFSCSNYPLPGGTKCLYEGNDLYVDDVELIYSSRIDKLTVNGKEWKEFNPDTDKVQTYQLPITNHQSPIAFAAYRGIGTLTHTDGTTKVRFPGRELGDKEMTVTPGEVNGNPWIITVKADDGSSEHTYRIKVTK